MILRKKSIVLIVLIAVVSVCAVLDVSIYKEDVFVAFGEQFENDERTEQYVDRQRSVEKTAERRLEIDRTSLREVRLSVVDGRITVRRSAGNTIVLETVMTAAGADMDEVERKLGAVQIDQNVDNDRLIYESTYNGRPLDQSSITADYALHLPDGLALKLDNDGGTVDVVGIEGDVGITSERGFVNVTGTDGNVTLDSDHDSVYLSNINGDIDLNGEFSNTQIEQVTGQLQLESRHGVHFISEQGGGVTAVTEHGTVHLREIFGPVDMTSEFTHWIVDRIRNDLKINAQSGQLKFVMPESEGYTFDIAVRHGTLVSHLPFPVQPAKDGEVDLLTGVIGDGAWSVQVEAETAEIYIHTEGQGE